MQLKTHRIHFMVCTHTYPREVQQYRPRLGQICIKRWTYGGCAVEPSPENAKIQTKKELSNVVCGLVQHRIRVRTHRAQNAIPIKPTFSTR